MATRSEGPSTRETSIEAETSDSEDDLPTGAEAVARCAVTFDATDEGRLPNGTDRWNAYAGSCHLDD